MRFEKELEQFLQDGHTEETVKSYLYGIRHFVALNPKAVHYDYYDVVNYLDDLTRRCENPVTRGTQLSAIKKYYDFLVMTGKRNNHPCRSLYIRRPKHQVQVQDLFTPEELESLMERENRYQYLEERNKILTSLLIYQGMKSQEICELNLQNIDLDEGTIYIKATRTSSSRKLELHRKQILILDKYIHHSREMLYTGRSKRLLVTQRGEPFQVNTITAFLKPLKYVYPDRRLNAKTIRQSVIANWLNVKKYPLGDVQIMAGHRYPSSTERYLSNNTENKRKLINQFHPLQQNIN